MTDIRQKITEIISQRAAKLGSIEQEINIWALRKNNIIEVIKKLDAAERLSVELNGNTELLRGIEQKISALIAEHEREKARFARNTLCIGVGGAARMGKSTFLQSLTGLAEEQIPTSDKYFTTAVRSQIENSKDNFAIADFHSESSFLNEIIKPSCDTLSIRAPLNLNEFRSMKFAFPEGERRTQESDDILNRLQSAQTELPEYENYLTGKRGQRIELSELRPFVAYPEGGQVKAGPFLAIADLVIRVPFPSTDVSQLRVVDLPGLGEAGRDLAKIHTEGMADICDITLLMKRPTDSNVEWTLTDTNALDAMSEAVPLLDDQTKFTVILANVGAETFERAEACVATIKNNLPRPFEIIKCNALDSDSVIDETMPRILQFLAKNLPAIDNSILRKLNDSSEATLDAINRELQRIRKDVVKYAPEATGDYDLAREIRAATIKVLIKQTEAINKEAEGLDEKWTTEIDRIHEEVKNWIETGCHCSSNEELLEKIKNEIQEVRGQPNELINAARTGFRSEWEVTDKHLKERIAHLLIDVMDALQEALHSFVPERDLKLPPLESVRNQILQFANRIESRHSDPGDPEALKELSKPLIRIAEFDLQFRFHLEPMLHVATKLLLPNELPLVNEAGDSQNLFDALKEKLKKAADDYAVAMKQNAVASSSALDKQKRLLEQAIQDEVLRSDVFEMLQHSAVNSQSFSPNRIFAAVIDTFEDSFLRSSDSEKAFHIIAKEWRNELTPALDDKSRLLNEAAGALTALKF